MKKDKEQHTVGFLPDASLPSLINSMPPPIPMNKLTSMRIPICDPINWAMLLYATGANSSKRQYINWEIRMCPRQPGATECGYCVLKYMKNIVYGGPEMFEDRALLVKDKYDPEDFLDIREDWAAFVHPFIFQNVDLA